MIQAIDLWKKIKNLLSDGGFVILSTPREEVREEWVKRFGDPKQPIEEWISTNDLVELIDDCGFKRIGHQTASWLNVYQIHLFSV